MKYQKKPVAVDAINASEIIRNPKKLPEWLKMDYERGNIVVYQQSVHIKIIGGTLIAGLNDWIIRDSSERGCEIYLCQSGVFNLAFELAGKNDKLLKECLHALKQWPASSGYDTPEEAAMAANDFSPSELIAKLEKVLSKIDL